MKKITKDTYVQWFTDMSFWRRFEDKCRSLYLKQKIRGFLHLYNGEEAIPAGLTHAMDMSKDRIITAYRCHILSMAMGVDPKKIMAELFGKVTGTSHGMGGSMHIFSKEHRFYGGHGIVGGQIPLGAGVAFADNYFNRGAVTLTLMGDGAVRQGSLHETFNLAMTWKLPVVFICENNQYAMGTSVERTTNLQDIYKIGLSYDMPSAPVDGMDPVKVAEASYEAIDRARSSKGPTFLEIKTYRYRGHSMSDAEPYRNKDEIEQYKKQDPILKTRDLLLKNQWADESQLSIIEEQAKERVEECVRFAEDSDFPPLEQMYDLVYEQKNYPFWGRI
ncbi:pyruvate dehydrogenase (acetyl-transferring) E1 component subunit alpha [Bacteroidetes bacterium endosymbiont of Geopemphigus sp.]|uniref:pyruvate dehydrogenase (acetyl-transferring) E1 component subunit alpha n=1 Tax=Bacteroidetes bacterium endosymbiont of Geopemphigus sp. TaxID=2047937 RepID=UPI000CD11158|nr:pyruvate dehydrogenase (acetyl-transferring) E1 component subunit alpha [Bacteroidetes bacterium endosymbiont of Geopemphigus sp.]